MSYKRLLNCGHWTKGRAPMKGTKAMKRSVMHLCIAAAFAAAWGTSAPAFATDEVEPNDTAGTAQPLFVGSDGTAQMNGVVGVVSGTPVADVDFYSFDFVAKDGGACSDTSTPPNLINNVSISMDNVKHADGTGVDAVVAIFGPEVGPDGTTDPLATLILGFTDDSGSVH